MAPRPQVAAPRRRGVDGGERGGGKEFGPGRAKPDHDDPTAARGAQGPVPAVPGRVVPGVKPPAGAVVGFGAVVTVGGPGGWTPMKPVVGSAVPWKVP